MSSRIIARVFTFLLAFLPVSAGAQEFLSLQPTDQVWRSEFVGMRDRLRTQNTLPLLLAGTVLTTWSTFMDPQAQSTFSSEGGWWGGTLVDVGDLYGSGQVLFGLSAVTYGFGTLLGDSKLQVTGRKLFTGVILDGAVVHTMKTAFGRRRPDGSDKRSFPSGHTSGAFTASTILARRHGWRIGVPAYALASLTAVGRMEDSRHYVSDVVAGAFLGVVIGRLMTPSQEEQARVWSVYGAPSGAGIAIAF